MSDVVKLAADYGWGPYTLIWIFIIAVSITTATFLIVMATSNARKKMSFAKKRKYHIEAIWAVGVAAVLVWLWLTSYPWMPPVAFSSIDTKNPAIQVVNVTAGQWFWLLDKTDDKKPLNPDISPDFHQSPRVEVAAGEPVKFVAHSVDVNHGFGVYKGADDGAPILFQMQVIPNQDNVFYYTFKEPGTYLIRCLEYCGYAHPYMTSAIIVVQGGNAVDGGAAVAAS